MAAAVNASERVRVLVAAAAARLAMNLPGEPYGRLTEVVVYPSHYVHPGQAGGVVFGEAHRHGTVVLSWEAVLQGFKNEEDGHNVALHELAHVLDAADGAFDGTPVLDIKPYMRGFEPRGEVREPEWAGEIMRDYCERERG